MWINTNNKEPDDVMNYEYIFICWNDGYKTIAKRPFTLVIWELVDGWIPTDIKTPE